MPNQTKPQNQNAELGNVWGVGRRFEQAERLVGQSAETITRTLRDLEEAMDVRVAASFERGLVAGRRSALMSCRNFAQRVLTREREVTR